MAHKFLSKVVYEITTDREEDQETLNVVDLTQQLSLLSPVHVGEDNILHCGGIRIKATLKKAYSSSGLAVCGIVHQTTNIIVTKNKNKLLVIQAAHLLDDTNESFNDILVPGYIFVMNAALGSMTSNPLPHILLLQGNYKPGLSVLAAYFANKCGITNVQIIESSNAASCNPTKINAAFKACVGLPSVIIIDSIDSLVGSSALVAEFLQRCLAKSTRSKLIVIGTTCNEKALLKKNIIPTLFIGTAFSYHYKCFSILAEVEEQLSICVVKGLNK